MSLTLLAPWALAAGALLAVPILIHLFKPRRVRQTPFSSLRWLHLTPQKLSRRIQWHQVLLFLLRAGFIVLLVLALAKPTLTAEGEPASRERFIVVDVSHSMNYRAADQATPIERAREVAADLVGRHRARDHTAILLAGAQTNVLTPLSQEPKNYLPRLKKVQAGLTGTDLGSALPIIRGMLRRPRPGAAVEIWFVTDNRQHAWRQGALAEFLEDLSTPVTVRVVDVGMSVTQNAWITRARLLELGRPARRVLRVELNCDGGEQKRTLHIDAGAGMPARSQEITLSPDVPTSVDFPVPASAELQTGVLRFHLEPSDALPGDDEFLLNLDTQSAARVLLVEGPATAADPHPSGLRIRTALEALADTSGQPLRLSSVAAATAKPADFRGADVIFLADVPEMSDEALTALEDRVRGGAGVAVILGSAGKPGWINERLYKPLRPSEGLLPAPVRPANRGEDVRAPLTSVQWSHPLLAGLDDPKFGDLGTVRSRQWYEFTAPLDEQSTVPARIDEEAPAIIDRTLGTGRVVVLNTGAGDRWSNLPSRNIYIPFIDRLLSHLAGAGLRRNFTVGEIVTLPLSGWNQSEAVKAVTPSGNQLKPMIRGAGEGRGLLTFDAEEAGVFKVERGDASMQVVVQASRDDSVLTPMNATLLKQWWSPADCAVIKGADFEHDRSAADGPPELWPWVLLAGGLVLLAEMFLVHYLCPRASPKLVQNLVAPRNLTHHSTRHG